MHNENWDDLRYVLTVAETGSVLQAAKRMGVNHATVLRHIASFEARHGERIFEKTSQGYRILPDRAHVIRAAQKAASAISEVSRLASGGHTSSSLTLRITSTDTLSTLILPRFVSQMAKDQPDVAISIHSSNAHKNVALDAAQVVVRPALELQDDLTGEKVAALGFAAYATRPDIDGWLGLAGALSRSLPARWMADHKAPESTTQSADSFLILRELAARGQGIAPLPCFVGDPEDRLFRLPDQMPSMAVPIWVAQPVDTVQSHELRGIISKLKDFLASEGERLAG